MSRYPTNLFSHLPRSSFRPAFQLFNNSSSLSIACFRPSRIHGVSSHPLFPPLNLHSARVRRKPERLPSSRCIESAQPRRARVRTLPTRASDTALRLHRTSPAFEADSFRLGDHPGNDHVASGTEFPGARQPAIVLSAIPSQVLRTGLHISGVPVASVPMFVAHQVSEVSRSSNLISRVSRMKSRASIAAAP